MSFTQTLKQFFTGKTEDSNMFSIKEGFGGFFIADRNGFIASGTSTYGRARDAKRGATRRGLTLA